MGSAMLHVFSNATAGTTNWTIMPSPLAAVQHRMHETEHIPLTPADIVMELLQPPWIYIILALLGTCLISFICTRFWDTFKPCVYACLDVLAVIFRFFFDIWCTITWTVRRCFYPFKESTL